MSNASEGGIVIGVGHADRQDDGVGPYVARGLSRRGLPAVVHAGDGAGLLELWDRRPVAIVVDAAAGGGAPGTVHVFTDPDDPSLAQMAFVHSTHRLGVGEAVALGRTLGRLPGRLVVIGITGAAFGFGGALSPPVASAAERVIDRLATAEDPFGEDFIADLQRV